MKGARVVDESIEQLEIVRDTQTRMQHYQQQPSKHQHDREPGHIAVVSWIFSGHMNGEH